MPQTKRVIVNNRDIPMAYSKADRRPRQSKRNRTLSLATNRIAERAAPKASSLGGSCGQ
jgi:hypothetical protein